MLAMRPKKWIAPASGHAADSSTVTGDIDTSYSTLIETLVCGLSNGDIADDLE